MPPTETTIPPANGSPYGARPIDKRAETITAGSSTGLMGVTAYVQALARRTGQVVRRYGDRVYDLISLDPVAGGSVDLLVYATLANDPQVVPRHKPRPGRATDDPERAAKEELSREVADYVSWTLEHLETPIQEADAQLTREALEYGCSIAELVWDVPESGPYAGTLVLKRIKPKPRRSWSFAVDAFWNVVGILASNVTLTALGGWQLLPREKFVVRTWGPRGSDPRGTSIYDRAAEAWNFRAQLLTPYFKFCMRHASPRPFAKLSQESITFLGTADDGSYDPNQNVLAANKMLTVLLNWINGQAAVVGEKDDIIIPDPKTDGQAFNLAMDYGRREIVLAILLQARATMEAQHSSKADGESSQDLMGNLIRFLRKWDSHSIEWDVLYKIVEYRYGKDVADEHTPCFDLGEVEHQDVVEFVKALAKIGVKALPSQLPELFAMAGLPVPDMDEIDQQEAKADAANQAANQPPPADSNAPDE